MTIGFAIPLFDHPDTIGAVVDELAPFALPCIIVDDCSASPTMLALEALTRRHTWVEVVRHARNGGKGAALKSAYRRAGERGWSHVIQLDADGQHDLADVPRFLDAVKAKPEALVLGAPVFDESAPWIRLNGRKLSQGVVRWLSGSKAVRDPLCGFRGMPLAATLSIIGRDTAHDPTGDRMEFDPEIVIRLVRAGVPVVNIPTAVRYPEDGVSHFRMVCDNLQIAGKYARIRFSASHRGS